MEIATIIPLIFGKLGTGEIILIVILIVLLFGAKKIPELMRGAGRGIKEFKDAMNKDYSADDKKEENNDKPDTEKKKE